MTEVNPYESPLSESVDGRMRLHHSLLIALWAALPVVVFVARQVVTPIFDEFGTELPAVTKLVLSFYAPIVLALISIFVIVVMFVVRRSSQRGLYTAAAAIMGALVYVLCLLAFCQPLFSLMQNLN